MVAERPRPCPGIECAAVFPLAALALAALALLPGLLVVRAPWTAVPAFSLAFWALSAWWPPVAGLGRGRFLSAALLAFGLLSLLRLLPKHEVPPPPGLDAPASATTARPPRPAAAPALDEALAPRTGRIARDAGAGAALAPRARPAPRLPDDDGAAAAVARRHPGDRRAAAAAHAGRRPRAGARHARRRRVARLGPRPGPVPAAAGHRRGRPPPGRPLRPARHLVPAAGRGARRPRRSRRRALARSALAVGRGGGAPRAWPGASRRGPAGRPRLAVLGRGGWDAPRRLRPRPAPARRRDRCARGRRRPAALTGR